MGIYSMGIQILLLYYLILSIFTGILAETNLLLKNAKKTTEECYCVPIKDSGMRVSEILNSELQQNERLVVYLYKNSQNEVTIYIPNSEKQKILPEFTLDNDDLLKKNATVDMNNLFYSDKSDVMLHDNTNSFEVNSNQLLDVQPGDIVLSNQPYLSTGYTQFLHIPLNFNNIQNCCDITLPGQIHHHLDVQEESTCCDVYMLLESLYKNYSHLSINTKEIAKHEVESNEIKGPSNVDTMQPQHVWDYITSELNEKQENILVNPDDIQIVLDSTPQSDDEKPSNLNKNHSQDVLDLLTPALNDEKPSNSGNDKIPQDVLHLTIPQLNKENSPSSLKVFPQDVLDSIIAQLNKENPLTSDNAHLKDALELLKRPSDEQKSSNSDLSQDVLDLIIAQLNKEKPSNSGNLYPQDVLRHTILGINKKKKPADLHNVYPQDVLESKKLMNPVILGKEYQVNVDSDYVDIQDLVDHQHYQNPSVQDLKEQQNDEILVTQDLVHKQEYTKPSTNRHQSKNDGKYNDDTSLLLNRFILSLKEKYNNLFNQNETSGDEENNGPTHINDHYMISILNRPQMNHRPSGNTFGHVTFDQWLSLQVKLLEKYKYVMSYTIDIKMLKIRLQNILYENGISITNAGDLININGERLNIDSLEMRPVLIGDPLKYEEFLSSHECVIASKFPYIEAILVTLSNPRRFLGLISLSETSFFDSRRSGSYICPPSSNESSVSSVPMTSENLVGYSNRRSSPNDLPDYPDKVWRSEKNKVKPHDNDFEDISWPKELGSEDNDYSDIGLRIIGGQAATSSGTPVSSKGKRSING